MTDLTMRDYQIAAQVMEQRCAQSGKPLDVHWTADSFRDLLPRVREDSRAAVETTIAVLDDMTARYGESGHTIADVAAECGRTVAEVVSDD